MSKQYYIRISEELMKFDFLNGNEKIFLAFLEVLTDKGTRGTDKSNLFFATKLNVSSAYISTMINKFRKYTLVFVGREYSRRKITLNTKLLLEKKLIKEKTKRGAKNVKA